MARVCFWLSFCMALSVWVLGCSTGLRGTDRYGFMRAEPGLAEIHRALSSAPASGSWLAAFISQPVGYRVCFGSDDPPWSVGETDGEPLVFQAGMYPFVLKQGPSGSCRSVGGESFSGALAVYNLDHAVDGLTFGKTGATQIFRPELLAQARGGLLSSSTIQLDGKPRVTYWLGNRSLPWVGGKPTVELQFSGSRVTDVRIDGVEARDLRMELAVPEPGWGDAEQRHSLWVRLDDGREFDGHVARLVHNEFTTFMRVPCALPDALFTAARDGAVKLSIRSQGPQPAVIAEIVLNARH